MKKVVCPTCGGPLIFESLCQYGRQYSISKTTGRLSKKAIRVDHGPIECNQLLCCNCKKSFDEEKFNFDGASVQLCSEEDFR